MSNWTAFETINMYISMWMVCCSLLSNLYWKNTIIDEIKKITMTVGRPLTKENDTIVQVKMSKAAV